MPKPEKEPSSEIPLEGESQQESQEPVLSGEEMAEVTRKANEAGDNEPQTPEELAEKGKKTKRRYRERANPRNIR